MSLFIDVFISLVCLAFALIHFFPMWSRKRKGFAVLCVMLFVCAAVVWSVYLRLALIMAAFSVVAIAFPDRR